jgi:hypothetical protein
LPLPFQIADSTIDAGDALPSRWNFPWDLLGAQIYHQQPILGGYIGRVPKRFVKTYQSNLFFHQLIALEEGDTPANTKTDGCPVAREFGISYVLAYPTATRPEALQFVHQSLPLTFIQTADGVELYRVDCESAIVRTVSLPPTNVSR